MTENNTKRVTLAKADVGELLAQTLTLCNETIRKHHTSRMYFSNCVNELLQKHDKAAEDVKEFYRKISSKVKEHQGHLEGQMEALLVDRQKKCTETTAAIDTRSKTLRDRKKELEHIQASLQNEPNPSAKDLIQLYAIRDEIKRIHEDNEKTASRDIANDFTEIDCGFVADEIESFFRLLNYHHNTMVYVNACRVKPDEIYLQIRGDKEFVTHETYDAFVVSNVTTNLFISCLRLEAVNLQTNVTERLHFKMAFPTSVSFEFRPVAQGEYEIRAYLYERLITGSPMRLTVGAGASAAGAGGLQQQLEISTVNSSLSNGAGSSSDDVYDLSAKLQSSRLSHGRGTSSGLVGGPVSQENGPLSGIGRGQSKIVTCGGRGRFLDSSILLRTPGWRSPNSDTNTTFESVASSTAEPKVKESGGTSTGGLSNNLNRSVSATNGYKPNYMGRIFDSTTDSESPIVPVETLIEPLVEEPPRPTSRNDNNIDEAPISNSSQEDWDYDSTSARDCRPTAGVLPNPVAANYGGDVRSDRFDLTPLIQKGGISAKLVLNMGKMDVTEPATAYFKSPIGCTSNLRLGQYIICDTIHNAVKIYSTEGVAQTMIDGNGDNPQLKMNRPSAVVVLDDDSFVVKDNSQLYKFSPDGQLLDIFGGGGRFQMLFGLCKTDRNVLLTFDLRSKHRKPPTLYGIDADTGKILLDSEFHVRETIRGSKCYFMDCVNDQLVVADLGLSKGYICTAEGSHLKTFGERERVRGEAAKFNEPSGVTLDRVGNILICDSRNNRVQVWDKDGIYLGTINFNANIHRPSNIHLTSDGHLLVMNYPKHYVSVFKLEPLTTQ